VQVAGNLLHYDQFFCEFNVSALSKTLLHMLHRYSLNEEGEPFAEVEQKENDRIRWRMGKASI
jgi:hypothetical protein